MTGIPCTCSFSGLDPYCERHGNLKRVAPKPSCTCRDPHGPTYGRAAQFDASCPNAAHAALAKLGYTPPPSCACPDGGRYGVYDEMCPTPEHAKQAKRLLEQANKVLAEIRSEVSKNLASATKNLCLCDKDPRTRLINQFRSDCPVGGHAQNSRADVTRRTVFEPGERLFTLSSDGVAREFQVLADGTVGEVDLDGRLIGPTSKEGSF